MCVASALFGSIRAKPMEGRGESMILMNSVVIRSIETTGGRSRFGVALDGAEVSSLPKVELTGKANGSHHAERVIHLKVLSV